MSTSSLSTSSDDELNSNRNPNPNTKPIDDELSLASITLTESNGNGSVNVNDQNACGQVEVDVEGPSSPTSSGYAGERGSSSEGTSNSRIDDDDEIREVINDDGFVDGVRDARAAPWMPGKRHVDEVSLLPFVVSRGELLFTHC